MKQETIDSGIIIAGFALTLICLAGRNRRKMQEASIDDNGLLIPETQDNPTIAPKDWINRPKDGLLTKKDLITTESNRVPFERVTVEGIGAAKPKRRIWREIEDAQRAGIDLTDKNAWTKHTDLLRRMANGKIREDGKLPMEQRYFNQLSRSYKSIAGTGLPYDQAVVRNEYGDVILIYNDYHLDQLPKAAADEMESAAQQNAGSPYAYGYWATVAAIAKGKKFVWKSKGVHRGIETLVFGQAAPAERKQRISYLATPEKGGTYPEQFAHSLWEANDSQQDDQEITNGVLDAIRDTPSVSAAQQACIQAYLEDKQVSEPQLYQDVPF